MKEHTSGYYSLLNLTVANMFMTVCYGACRVTFRVYFVARIPVVVYIHCCPSNNNRPFSVAT